MKAKNESESVKSENENSFAKKQQERETALSANENHMSASEARNVIWNQEDYSPELVAKAKARYEEFADEGNIDVMLDIAIFYLKNFFGYGDELPICERYEKSHIYFQKASDLGSTDGMYHLGIQYSLGQGCDKDEKKAFDLFQKATDMGNLNALFNLGQCYQYGTGCEENLDKAVECFTLAMNRGCEFSKYALRKLKEPQY